MIQNISVAPQKGAAQLSNGNIPTRLYKYALIVIALSPNSTTMSTCVELMFVPISSGQHMWLAVVISLKGGL